MKTFEIIATSTFGLESIVRKEVEDLGYEVNSVSDGKVTYTGDTEAVVLSNLWLRSADRVLIKMGEFKATSFEELFNEVNSLPWEAWITQDAKFTVNGKSIKSALFSISDCQAIVKKSIVKRLQQHYDIEWFQETGPSYTVQVSLLKDIATLTIDTTGEVGLHKRGYRKSTVEAPIKETLAAALLQISYWKKGRILYDPCCGSGTFAIEAAMIAKNIAPGLKREFASSHWEQIPKTLWEALRQEAIESIDQKGNPIIYASDIDRNAILSARDNAIAAGVDEYVQFFAKPLHKTSLPHGDYGVVICNPPYGERLSDLTKIQKLHKDIRALMNSNPTWSLYTVTSVETFEKDYGKKADKKRKLYNGNLQVNYYQYFGPKPPKGGENFKAIPQASL
ncbi:THUMP domain-containing class I SAM-dependent RNA methyltransferase [Cellulosilyticum sp. I15G10I2]|uniref:THUMP domain-containing class I SAM-dependent RNA methyltransferase n=1 Tax=Cellulosilyticum sp. I15G10I2 TaxID=1892843 RepID=UPI00085C7698|nr:class I SAM-dependent RNA methyltransferase [Cellulosilyticum sp. I15G10I2]